MFNHYPPTSTPRSVEGRDLGAELLAAARGMGLDVDPTRPTPAESLLDPEDYNMGSFDEDRIAARSTGGDHEAMRIVVTRRGMRDV